MDSNEELIRTLMKLIPFQQGKDRMTKSKIRRKKTRIVKSLQVFFFLTKTFKDLAYQGVFFYVKLLIFISYLIL